jgi:hypothetical protein
MRSKTTLTRAITCFLGLTSLGCGFPDVNPLIENPVEVTLDFCSDEIPIWFAVQNGNQPVTVVPADGNGTFTFTATRRVTIAFVRENGGDYKTDIISTSSNDLEPLSDDVCIEDSGTKTVNGTVAGVPAPQVALVGMSSRSALLTAGQTSFSLTQLADRPLDLIASRIDLAENTQHANTTIIRRSLNVASGSALGLIDFDAEGFVTGLHSLSANGIEPNVGVLVNTFISQQETSHTLSVVDSIQQSGSVPFMAIPEGQMVGGEYHEAVLTAANDAGYTRGFKSYFRDPGIQTLTLGPDIGDPIVTEIASQPYTRLQATLNGQLEYARVVVADFEQQTPSSTIEVSVTVTASHLGGTPFAWSVPIPDFTGIPGWDNSWGLQPGNTVDWTVSAYFVSPRLLFGDRPVHGETFRFASRSSSISAAQAFRARQGHSRSRIFSRLH